MSRVLSRKFLLRVSEALTIMSMDCVGGAVGRPCCKPSLDIYVHAVIFCTTARHAYMHISSVDSPYKGKVSSMNMQAYCMVIERILE